MLKHSSRPHPQAFMGRFGKSKKDAKLDPGISPLSPPTRDTDPDSVRFCRSIKWAPGWNEGEIEEARTVHSPGTTAAARLRLCGGAEEGERRSDGRGRPAPDCPIRGPQGQCCPSRLGERPAGGEPYP